MIKIWRHWRNREVVRQIDGETKSLEKLRDMSTERQRAIEKDRLTDREMEMET